MATPLAALLNVDPAELTEAHGKYTELVSLLPNTCNLIAALTKLVCVVTQREDFDLHGKGASMSTQSFTGAIVQVTNWGCSALTFCGESAFPTIQAYIERMPSNLRDMVDNCEDDVVFADNAETLEIRSRSSEIYANAAVSMLSNVTNLINEITEQLNATEGIDSHSLHECVQETVKEIQVVSTTWTHIRDMNAEVKTLIKTSIGITTADRKKHNTDNTPEQQLQHLAHCVIVAIKHTVITTALTTAFAEMYEQFLEKRIRALGALLPEANKNKDKFDDLVTQCFADATHTAEIVSNNAQSIAQRIEEELANLAG